MDQTWQCNGERDVREPEPIKSKQLFKENCFQLLDDFAARLAHDTLSMDTCHSSKSPIYRFIDLDVHVQQ